MVEGIAWRYRTGSPWRDVPAEFGPCKTLWKRHDRWSRDGTWDVLLAVAHSDAEIAGELEWVASVDSTVARAHQHAAGARNSTTHPSPEPATGSDSDTAPERHTGG